MLYKKNNSESRKNKLFIEKIDLFKGQTEGYYTHRIPTIVVSNKGTILVFAEARTSDNDWAARAIVMRRSFDNGNTWEPSKTIVSDDKKSDDPDDFFEQLKKKD